MGIPHCSASRKFWTQWADLQEDIYGLLYYIQIDYNEDMCTLSEKFPTVVFKLHGAGEAGDDLWDTYYWKGRYQHCPAIITYEPFRPEECNQRP